MNRFVFYSLLLLLLARVTCANAQNEDTRNKIEMTVDFNGRTYTADINSLSVSLARDMSSDVGSTINPQDSTASNLKLAMPQGNFVYLTFEVKQINKDLLQVLAKRANQFNGTIVITDSYGKNPTRTLAFKTATLYSYSDQFSAFAYNTTFGNTAISVACKTIAIDGVLMEH